ncbi:sulfatase-like hydrolase/transferase [Pseudomonas typographi]|uniref:Sulfatase-like hydrolase/transferase n=1 Tax=Pseudomonas typographi TaxID=2715964 RepID=A0ABR7Z924_9PSED|nr:sulfatase-like hydrolase/transferase [Pseudomonas typographi]MBD1552290.1 sulfatase-like hydrolase/transferase [Pseudomonas typographi]MBD1587410.1 sulfatase-like hydrolase/transferase [Pseudomonas typographi]MBD1601949.1 sulfatase-like hydrolase/transferase [Pseudomonas typographi]
MAKRPNFVVIVADQLRVDCLPGFNDQTPVRTPHLDRLAAQGVRFGQAFTQHSVCSPSRVSFLSGRYPHVGGHRTLQYLLTEDEPNFLRTFRDNGYHVVHAGARGDTFAAGAAERSVHEHGFADPALNDLRDFFRPRPGAPAPGGSLERAHYEGEKPAGQVGFDEAVIRTAEAWLAKPHPEPWVLYIPLVSPHPPFAVEQPWFSLYPRDAIALPRHGSGPQPAFHAELARLHGWDRLQAQHWQELRAVYFGMVSYLDSLVGRVMASVQRHPLGGTTYTAFFSDHGEYLGDYGLVEKWPAGVEECLVRTPLIISGPGLAKGAQSDALIELIDVFPTLLDLAGVAADHPHYGRSFVGCLQDPLLEHRDAVFSEGGFREAESDLLERGGYPYDLKSQLQHDQPRSVGKVVARRDQQWTYVWRLYEPAQLFHRPSDPHEQHNLAGLAQYAAVERALMEKVLHWQVETADLIDPRQQERFAAVALPRPG